MDLRFTIYDLQFMTDKLIKLQSPTVKELIKALRQLPQDAIITDSDVGNFVGINIKSEKHHWDDDGDGNPVDYDIAEFSFYSLDSDY